jgi:two-component system, LuxR family, sensor kinase FixL
MTSRYASRLSVDVGLIAGYVFLDWVSYIHPFYGLNITPWNPAPALGLLFILRSGLAGATLLFVAILIAEAWVRGLPASLPATVGLSLLLTAGYAATGMLLRRWFPYGRVFDTRRGLLLWASAVVGGTLVTSVAFVSAVSLAEMIPVSSWSSALVRFWIGDGVGIIVSMPILWLLSEPHGRAMLRNTVVRWEVAEYVLLALAALWIAFGVGAEADFKYLYVLFLPIVWAAARQGFVGAVVGAGLVQTGIIAAVQLLGYQVGTVLEIQMLALLLALVGFFVGLVVDEQRRLSTELRHTLRLAAAGEMAGALAHELNQPLTAISAYGAACQQLLDAGDVGARLRNTIGRMVAESVRAAEVVRRLRDFFRTGATRLESLPVSDLVDAATTRFQERARRDEILLTVRSVAAGTLLADRTQLEVVLRNLLANAFDAAADAAAGDRWVRVAAETETGSRLRISIEDGGPGVSGTDTSRIFEPFQSNKTSGLGLGLAVSRTIVEAHGGNLWAEAADHGVFKLVLPLERGAAHGDG